MTWRPLLDGDDRARARALVDAIADEIDRRAPDEPSLAFGQAGVAILHGYRARAGCADGADRAYAALERALANLAVIPEPWLFHGTAGVGFAVHHLADVVGDASDVLAQVDALILQALAIDPLPSWDLTHGCVGLGVYGLERGAPAIVERVAAYMAAIAERVPDGVTWRTYVPEAPGGFFNLGLAHGVACAIAFLAEAHAAGQAGAATPAIVRDAVRWLCLRERDRAFQRYPMADPEVDRGSRGILDGWCYGDPSTALVLVRAGGMLREPPWREAGRALAHHAARRTDDELARLAIDTTLCHGAIGHAHIYNRLGQHLDDDELRAAARRWYARVLADDVIAVNSVPGLQLGLAGVALGLLAASTDVDPAWDRAFLISLAPR